MFINVHYVRRRARSRWVGEITEIANRKQGTDHDLFSTSCVTSQTGIPDRVTEPEPGRDGRASFAHNRSVLVSVVVFGS